MTSTNELLALQQQLVGKRVLHIGHKDADCDALGSAFAMCQVIPGEVGVIENLKVTALDLAESLKIELRLNPDPDDYDYVLIYDTSNVALLGAPMPERFALFDHHMPGGHRFGTFQSELAEFAEYAWVRPVESTSSLLVDLFCEAGIPITRRMGLALAAGMVTDTAWLRLANGDAFSRLAEIFNQTGLTLEDVMNVIDNPERQTARRTAVVAALREVEECTLGRWSMLTAKTDNHDNAYAVLAALGRLSVDFRMVVFPKQGQTMVMIECDSALVNQTGIDLGQMARHLAGQYPLSQSWGTAMWGRMIAPACPHAMLVDSRAALAEALMRHTYSG